MCKLDTDDVNKIEAYFVIIDEHIIEPITDTDLRKSCIATIMLLFAAMEGLGKLIHPSGTAGPGQRFRAFLARMGKNYDEHAGALWDLRNSLMHNALNTASFMSSTHMDEQEHLRMRCPDGLIFVSTILLLKNFCSAKDRLQEELHQNPDLLERAANRLEWLEEDPRDWPRFPTTPPPPVKFIAAR